MRRLLLLAWILVSACGGCGSERAGSTEPSCEGDCACADELGNCVAEDPICYTPCSANLVAADGTVRVCDDDGLVEGCLDGSVCDRGTCVPAALLRLPRQEAAKARQSGDCEVETDCTDFQTCIEGRCASTCRADEECADGAECYRRVCRATCTEEHSECPNPDHACFSGRCVPTVPASDHAVDAAGGSFDVDATVLALSARAPERALTITNSSPITRVFEVRPVAHRREVDGQDEVVEAPNGQPLPWVELTSPSAVAYSGGIALTIPATESATVTVSGEVDGGNSSWSGSLEVSSEGMGSQTVLVRYAAALDGAWTGRVYSFGAFEDGETATAKPLEDWSNDRTNLAALEAVPNAFVGAWARYRNNILSYEEFRAVLASTIDRTWRQARVSELCGEAGYGDSAVCVPYGGSGSTSVLLYSSDSSVQRIPSGVVELDFSINMRRGTPAEVDANPTCANGTDCFVGRIDSDWTLQYAGNPQATLVFDGSPQDCAGGGDRCRVNVADFRADIAIGGRYIPAPTDSTCQLRSGISARSFPWLVSGFVPSGVTVPSSGPRERIECVDGEVPGGDTRANEDLARANPVPDGLPRFRHLELVDGFVLDQQTAYLLVRETVDPFVPGGAPLRSYALIQLERQKRTLDPAEFQATPTEDVRPPSSGALGLSCVPELISAVRGGASTLRELSRTQLADLARAVVRGDTSAVGDPAPATAASAGETLHYLCLWDEDVPNGSTTRSVQRQVFGAGAAGTTTCPARARVVYFALKDGVWGSSFDPATLPCNQSSPERCLDGNFAETLSAMVATGTGIRLMPRDEPLFMVKNAVFDLVYRCSDGDPTCDDDALDLLAGKTFLAGGQPKVYFTPLATEIRDAFRYRTDFVSRTGRNVGFAPDICAAVGGLTPYCYDPVAIESTRDRVDCALAIYEYDRVNRVFDPIADDSTLATLRTYLDQNFAQLQTFNPTGDPIVDRGFEELYAELLVMLGDDAYVASFAARFDLSGQNEVEFAGDRFEQGGPSLSGAAGFELYSLYRATQYYDMVLERFYSLSPTLIANVAGPSSRWFVSQRTVTSWLARVRRASTQHAAAWSEIARRYEALNRPDLARRVLSRAYARTFTEATILGDFVRQIADVVSPQEVDQVIMSLDETRLSYRVSMTDMRQAYDAITDNVNYFGLPPDLVPFPALSEEDVNGFDVMIERARNSLDAAAGSEAAALEQKREFDTDAELFRSELVGLRIEYEARLGEICGTFVGSDGRVYPGLRRYAHLDAGLATLDDPCGAVGNGELWMAGSDLETRYLELEQVRRQMVNLKGEFADAGEEVLEKCKLIAADRDNFLKEQQAIDKFEGSIDSMNLAIDMTDEAFEAFDKMLDYHGKLQDGLEKGFAGIIDVLGATIAQIGYGVTAGVRMISDGVIKDQIRRKQDQIRTRARDYEAWKINRECAYLEADLGPRLREIQREMDLAELDNLDAIWNIEAQLGAIRQLVNERIRVEGQWEESVQLATNAAAASSDPNVRLYKNDAIIGADRTFQRALRDVYRATRMYEYYTASSYANFEQLFLARLVRAGQYNLSRYVDELEEAFYDFEQEHGNPDTRVALVSLRDDVLKIPRYDDDGMAMSAEDRAEAFRAAITSDDMLDAQGYLSFDFSTTFAQLSPLTANHKIVFMEVEILGDDVGDNVGRIYLRQKGTGVVRNLAGENDYYAFPEQVAVMNPIFNGDRSFGQDADGGIAGPTRSIFRSHRFRDRPVVQTQWQLVLNQQTERVNDDINLAGIDDIVLTIFYTDFTPQN